MNYLEQLNWRYATKRMTGEKVPQEKIDRILEAIRLSASSMGIQPFKVLIIEDENLLKQIRPIAYNQPQITEASHLLIFTTWQDIPEEKVEDLIRLTASERGVSQESLEGYRKMILGTAGKLDIETILKWNSHQVYIALGSALFAAALEEVDSTPMEGFKPAELDELLNLREQGLRSTVMLTLGYRDVEADSYALVKKVRRPKEELFLKVNAIN